APFCRMLVLAFILLAGLFIPFTFAQNSSQADRLYEKANGLQNQARYDQSSAILRQAIQIYKEGAMWVQVAKCYNSLSFNARIQNHADKAEQFAQAALHVYEEYENIPPIEAVEAYHNLGIIYTEKHKFDKAHYWLQKGMDIARDNQLDLSKWVNIF